MKRQRFIVEQIIAKLRKAEMALGKGQTVYYTGTKRREWCECEATPKGEMPKRGKV